MMIRAFLSLCLAATVSGAFAQTATIDETWRRNFGVYEANPIATTGVRTEQQEFEEPDAMIFVKRNKKWRDHLLASDIRFEDNEPSKSRMLLFSAKPPYNKARMRLAKAFGEGVFVGKPKSVVEDSKGRFWVTDGLDKSDKVDERLREKQGIHLFDASLKHIGVYGQGVFESVNGIMIDAADRIYVTERSKGLVRRFLPDGSLDRGWVLEDKNVQKTDNMLISEAMVVGDQRGVIIISDEERGMIRLYSLADGRYLNAMLGNAPDCSDASAKSPACFRSQSLFNGNVEGMARFGNLLVLMDEADKPLAGREDGGIIWFIDLTVALPKAINQPGQFFSGRGSSGLLGGIHKSSPYTQKKIEKDRSLAEGVARGTFISADSVDVHQTAAGKRLLAVANQGLNRLEMFDLDRVLTQIGVSKSEQRRILAR